MWKPITPTKPRQYATVFSAWDDNIFSAGTRYSSRHGFDYLDYKTGDPKPKWYMEIPEIP